MNIVHICLTGPFTDGWNYQENVLTKYHVRLGHSVTVITTEWCWNENNALVKSNEHDYTNSDGVHIIRLPIKGGHGFEYRFKRYKGLVNALNDCNMDIMFVHDTQMLDTKILADYLKQHKNVIAYSDCHADFSNSATNWLSKNILHKVIWKYYAQLLEPYVRKFYGTLPARVDFLKNVYGLPKEKCELLVMGADDDFINRAQETNAWKTIRKKYNINESDFLVVTGGKIDAWKTQTLLLMQG